MPDIMGMLSTHCPACKGIDCSDMNRCPLALAKWKGEFISPGQFAERMGIKPKQIPQQTSQQGTLF